MEFFRSVQEWLNGLSWADQNYIGAECQRQKAMLCEIIAGSKLSNKFVLDYGPEELVAAKLNARAGMIRYVIDYSLWKYISGKR